MTPRCIFFSVTAGLVIDSLIVAWYFDNGPLMILGVFAGLVWIWGAEIGVHYFRRER